VQNISRDFLLRDSKLDVKKSFKTSLASNRRGIEIKNIELKQESAYESQSIVILFNKGSKLVIFRTKGCAISF
jgi:hypothetical protein